MVAGKGESEFNGNILLMEKKHPAPVDMGKNIPLFTGFHTCQVISRKFLPSVLKDWNEFHVPFR